MLMRIELRSTNKKSYINIITYYIGYITIKNLSYVKINSVNPLYFIINKVDRFIEKSNGYKHWTLVSIDKNTHTLKIMLNYGIKLRI